MNVTLMLITSIFLLVLATVSARKIEVSIRQGKLKGAKSLSRKGREFYSYSGIPYAKAPVGDLRFKSPEYPEQWTDVRNAIQEGPICLQLNSRDRSLIGNEDCLYLNVYVPAISDDTKIPVMVWIHGGDWMCGSSSSQEYGPSFLMDQDIILVTFNYRLGILGFLSTNDDVCPGNNGLKDQVAALKWIQKNIAAFGGDKRRVTIFGKGTGASSVHLHMFSPLSQGLFHQAISQSGTALNVWGSPKHSRQNIKEIALKSGCPTDSSISMISCLQRIDAAKLVSLAQKELSFWNILEEFRYGPVIEHDLSPEGKPFLTTHPLDILQNNEILFNIPWMTGLALTEGETKAAEMFKTDSYLHTFNENFDKIAPLAFGYAKSSPNVMEVNKKIKEFYFDAKNVSPLDKEDVINMFTDGYFLWNVDEAVRLHSLTSESPIYFYLFSYQSAETQRQPEKKLTSIHGWEELKYLFTSNESIINSHSPEDARMIDTLTTLWSNFAKTGNPTPAVTPLIPVEWDPVSSFELEYLNIGKNLKLNYGLLHYRAQFWSHLPLRKDSGLFTHFRDEL